VLRPVAQLVLLAAVAGHLQQPQRSSSSSCQFENLEDNHIMTHICVAVGRLQSLQVATGIPAQL
jgi:hypothetical protein